MKKIFKFIIVILIVFGVGYLFFKEPIYNVLNEARIKAVIASGKYVEIVYEDASGCKKIQLSNGSGSDCIKYDVKVRSSNKQTNDNIIGYATKGEVYELLDVEDSDPEYIWFRIKFQKRYQDKMEIGYIGQPRSSEPYVKFHGITLDYANPELRYKEDEYHVDSIDDINFDELEVWDDQPDYKLSYEVYIEREPKDGFTGPQYWIKWTITDTAGKSVSKIQRVIFKYPPSDSKVKDFADIRK